MTALRARPSPTPFELGHKVAITVVPAVCDELREVPGDPHIVVVGDTEQGNQITSSCGLSGVLVSSLRTINPATWVGVIRHRDDQINVPGEPRLDAHGHRQAADERERHPAAVQSIGDALQRSAERHHRRNRLLGRPAVSPCSAPGRVRSHDDNSSSISASDASGLRRRRF